MFRERPGELGGGEGGTAIDTRPPYTGTPRHARRGSFRRLLAGGALWFAGSMTTSSLNTEIRARGRHGLVRYVIDQDPAVARECAKRAGPGLIQIWDRRDRCFVQLYKTELLGIGETAEQPGPSPSTLHASARSRQGEGLTRATTNPA